MITEIMQFSLDSSMRSNDSPYENPNSAVFDNGRETGLIINGVKLESQFRLHSGDFVLITSDDSPFEETVWAYLVTSGHQIIEYSGLGYAYTAGILRDVKVLDGDTLAFSFAGSYRYYLKIHRYPSRFWSASGGAAELLRMLTRRRLQFTRERK
ncbi:MAG: hypothetical protein WBD27_10825 [Pyrinomonadaceae bacterium]